MKDLKRLVYLAVSVALAIAISQVEQLIPLPVNLPGAKLGLSNIVILVNLICFGFKDAFIVAILKSFGIMLVSGQVSSMFYSLAGSILSVIVMYLALKYGKNYFSIMGVSVLGSLAHNLGQFIVASIMLSSTRIFNYFPVLCLLGLFTGFFVGLSSKYISRHMKKILPKLNVY